MVIHNSQLIGYDLKQAIEKLDNNKEIVVQLTQTPLKGKQEERIDKKPIVIRHIEDSKRVILTISYFK